MLRSPTSIARWPEYMFISEGIPHVTDRFCRVELGLTFNSKNYKWQCYMYEPISNVCDSIFLSSIGKRQKLLTCRVVLGCGRSSLSRQFPVIFHFRFYRITRHLPYLLLATSRAYNLLLTVIMSCAHYRSPCSPGNIVMHHPRVMQISVQISQVTHTHTHIYIWILHS
jgi:hypothetical protein